MARPNNTIFAAWLRGGQTFGHTVAMIHGVIVFIGKWLLIPAIIAYICLFFWATDTEQEAGFLIFQARLFEWFGSPAPDVMSVPVPARGRENYHVSDIPYLPHLIPFAEAYYAKVRHCFMAWFLFASVLVAIQTYLFTTSGREKLKTRQIKGQVVVSAPELLRQIREFNLKTIKSRNLPPITPPKLAGIDYPIDGELEHTMITGGVGSGKSLAIHGLIQSIRERGDRAIIYDPEGEYIRDHYDPRYDVILNPFDDRSPTWSPFFDAKEQVEWDRLGHAIFKAPKAGDLYWTDISRSIFTWACYSLQSQNVNADLETALGLFFGKTDALRTALASTPASKHLGEENSQRTASIESMLTDGVQPLVYLLSKKQPFSIKSWINHPERRPGFLFLSAPESHIATLRPLLGFWADIAVSALLSRMTQGIPPIPKWIILDEFPSLGRVDSLAEGPARLRKHGGAMVFGLQQVSQLKDIYGTERALTIIGQSTNKLVLRANDPDTAKTMSLMLGERKMHRVSENTTYGANTIRDGVGIIPKEEMEPVFTTTQIMNFPALSGAIRVANRRTSEPFPIATVKFSPKDFPKIHLPFVTLAGPSPVEIFLKGQMAAKQGASGTRRAPSPAATTHAQKVNASAANAGAQAGTAASQTTGGGLSLVVDNTNPVQATASTTGKGEQSAEQPKTLQETPTTAPSPEAMMKQDQSVSEMAEEISDHTRDHTQDQSSNEDARREMAMDTSSHEIMDI